MASSQNYPHVMWDNQLYMKISWTLWWFICDKAWLWFIQALSQRDKPSKRLCSIKPRKRNTRCNSSSSPGSLKIGNHCNPEDDVRITKNKSVLLATNPRGPRQRAEIRVDTCWKPTSSQVWSPISTCLTNMDCVSSCDMPFVCHHITLHEGLVCFFRTINLISYQPTLSITWWGVCVYNSVGRAVTINWNCESKFGSTTRPCSCVNLLIPRKRQTWEGHVRELSKTMVR